MASFKLPRLKANLAIVDGRGRPLDYFLRLFNIELVQRIEQNETAQNEILDRLLAAEQAAAEAQQTAEEALAAAEAGDGAKYTTLNAAAGAATAFSVLTAVPETPRLQLTGQLLGGSLNANSAWQGQVVFTEESGGALNTLGTLPITTESSGLDLGGGEWQAEDSSTFSFDVFGTFDGAVTYRLNVTRTGGSEYVDGAEIRSSLTVTPKAT